MPYRKEKSRLIKKAEFNLMTILLGIYDYFTMNLVYVPQENSTWIN